MKRTVQLFSILLVSLFMNCVDDKPYLEGHIRRAADAVMTSCDPYNRGDNHTCIIYSSAFREKLFIYDATTEEMVLAPIGYWPLAVKVGASTHDLAAVKNGDNKFPFMFALDHAIPGLFLVRTFPSADKTESSFSTPKLIQLERKSYKLAAFAHTSMVVVILSNPNDGSIDILSFDKTTGAEKGPRKYIKIGSRPSHIEIDEKSQKAVISDETSQDIFVLDLKTIDKAMAGQEEVNIVSLNISMNSGGLFLSTRDFGLGMNSYIVALNSAENEIKLVNLTESKVEASLRLKERPMSVYFPDNKSETCCGGEKNWIAVAGIKGNLYYLGVKKSGTVLSLSELAVADMTSKRNMSLNLLHVRKLLGGSVMVDASVKREVHCPNNRKMFIVSSFGNERVNPVYQDDKKTTLIQESHEVEAHGEACEGKDAFSRLGFKRE